jgi:hypothetical protein
LKRRKTQPGGKVAAFRKGFDRRCQSGDRGGRDWADATNGHQPARYFVLASTSCDLFVEIRNLAIEAGEQV